MALRSANSVSSVTKKGWLIKRGRRIKNWRKRWFEVGPGALLRYFDKGIRGTIKGYLHVVGVEKGETEDMIVITGSRKRMLYVKVVDSDRDEWLAALEHAARTSTVDDQQHAHARLRGSTIDPDDIGVIGAGGLLLGALAFS